MNVKALAVWSLCLALSSVSPLALPVHPGETVPLDEPRPLAAMDGTFRMRLLEGGSIECLWVAEKGLTRQRQATATSRPGPAELLSPRSDFPGKHFSDLGLRTSSEGDSIVVALFRDEFSIDQGHPFYRRFSKEGKPLCGWVGLIPPADVGAVALLPEIFSGDGGQFQLGFAAMVPPEILGKKLSPGSFWWVTGRIADDQFAVATNEALRGDTLYAISTGSPIGPSAREAMSLWRTGQGLAWAKLPSLATSAASPALKVQESRVDAWHLEGDQVVVAVRVHTSTQYEYQLWVGRGGVGKKLQKVFIPRQRFYPGSRCTFAKSPSGALYLLGTTQKKKDGPIWQIVAWKVPTSAREAARSEGTILYEIEWARGPLCAEFTRANELILAFSERRIGTDAKGTNHLCLRQRAEADLEAKPARPAGK